MNDLLHEVISFMFINVVNSNSVGCFNYITIFIQIINVIKLIEFWKNKYNETIIKQYRMVVSGLSKNVPKYQL